MTKSVVAATAVSVVLGLVLIGGAVSWQLNSANEGNGDDAADAVPIETRSYTLEELARYNGEDGNECLVAVDGEVYLIEGFYLWKDGEHTPSMGRARCGLDLTEVIDEESPHGRSKLQLLKKVGTLE